MNLILNVDKPVGMTSFDVVRKIKRNLPKGFGKIGHFGTLDPFASGVLLIGIGNSLRLNTFLQELLPKTYLATGHLGVRTVTGDLTVSPCEVDETQHFQEKISVMSIEAVKKILENNFRGEYWQQPPMYSATKREGKPLYEYARAGIEVEREAKKRFIDHLEIVSFNFPALTFLVRVSSGTYIRTLFEDFAKTLGTIGSLQSLERVSVGDICQQDSLKREDWDTAEGVLNSLKTRGHHLPEVLPFPQIILNEVLAQRFSHGQRLYLTSTEWEVRSQQETRLLHQNHYWISAEENGVLLGLGQREAEILSPKIVFS